MASMNSWCYFFLVEIIMAKQKTKNIMNRFLQGWQQIFGGDRQEAVQNKLKPFPQNHFFRPEELDYLSKNSNLTTIEKWAVATGKWAFEQSKDKFSDCKYASVKWQDGLMATWVDGRIIPDTPSRQAEKLALLKEDGFEIPDKYEKIITNYEASRLVGKYFHNGNDVVKVEDYDKGHLIGDTPKLVLRRWDKDNFMEKSEKMEYADFKNEIGKSFVVLNDTDIKKFEKHLNNVEQGKKQFAKVLNYIRESYPPVFGGTLPLEMQKVHEVKAFDGKVIPASWSLSDGITLKVGVYTDNSNKKANVIVNEDNAHKYKTILDTLGKVIKQEQENGIIYSLVSVLGNDVGENKIYAKENNSVIFPANEGNVNAIVATKDGRVIPFDLNTHQEVPLDANEPGFLLVAMQSEGNMVRQKLRDTISIPKMKDYIESMRDKEELLSGDWDLIPSNTTVDKKLCEKERYEEEFHAYTHSSYSMSPEDRNEMIADLEASSLAFHTEMKKMIDAYNSHSYSFDENDVRKLEQLDAILGFNNNHQAVRHHKVNQPQNLTANEAALRDALVDKMKKNGMDVITDADEAKKVHQEASHEVKEMGSRVFKRMDKIGEELEGRVLNDAQKAVVSVYSRKDDNRSFTAQTEVGDKIIVMRQGNDSHAGTKHSVYRHFGTNNGFITSDDILRIPEIIEKGKRDNSKANGRVSYIYTDKKDNVKYTVVTEPRNEREFFCDFYTNKKVLSLKTSSLSEETNTNLIAHNDNDNTNLDAKIQQKDDTAKSDVNKLNKFKTSKGEIWGFATNGKIYIDPSVANAETPIHEYTHIWADAIRENNPNEWSNIVNLMKTTTLWGQIKKDYPELKTEDEVADEVLATYSGKRGAEKLRKEMSRMTNHGNMTEKAAAARSLGRMEHILNRFWKAVSDFLHIHFTSAENVADRPLKDLLDGIDPRVYIKGDKRIGNGKSVDVLPLREQRGQQTSETRFIDPLLLKAKTDGRWHTQEHMEKKVYKEYGSILAASKGLTVSDNGNESVPMDMSGHKYSGTTAMMLNIASRNHGYEVPVFLNLATMNANGIRVNENAVAIPVITKNGVENVYNIEQTDFPKKRPQEYSNMKLNQVLESRLSLENKDAIESLVNNKRFTTKTSFDSSVGSASYSTNDNTIHVAPVGEYDKKDGFLQDLSEGLVMRTRKSEPVSSRFENILKEGLIVHLGSGLVGQKYGYDVGETAGSKFWKERLKNDPNYTKTVLKAAEKSSDKIIDYVDKLQKGQSQSSNLDMRSTTPIDIDVDGNGIVESDENLAPDKKQGSDEEKDNNQEESHHQEHRYHRGR